SGPTVSVDDLHPPELLAPPAVHGRPGGRQGALGDRTEKVRVVVDPHDLALAAEPHGPGDARDLLGDRTVDAAVNDPVRLVQVRSYLERGFHAIAVDLYVLDADHSNEPGFLVGSCLIDDLVHRSACHRASFPAQTVRALSGHRRYPGRGRD